LKKERSKKYRLIQGLRILSQTIFFFLFFYLLLGTHFTGEDYIGRVEIFFHFDPLLALSTLIASRAVFISFLLAAVTIVMTFVLGRVVCGWVCPLGSIHQFFSFIFKKVKLLRPKDTGDKKLAWKYYLLIFILVGTLFALDLVGIFDPLSLLYRSFSVAVLPALSYSFEASLGFLYQINIASLADSLAQFFENLALRPSDRDFSWGRSSSAFCF
jgi:polyferredoxin